MSLPVVHIDLSNSAVFTESGMKPGFPGMDFGFLRDLESESTAEYAAAVEKPASETGDRHFRGETMHLSSDGAELGYAYPLNC